MLLVGQDPDWARQQSERWGNALASVQQIIQNKRAKEEREIQRSMELLARNPELADTLGADLVTRYGRKRPEIVSLVTTLQQQKKLQDESERNLSRYDKAISKEISQRQAFQQNLENMPDWMQQPLDQFGSVATVPNYAKQAARSQTAMLPDPEWSAFVNMPEDQRQAALVAMRRNKINPPKAPESMGPKDLNESIRGLYASGYDLTSPEVQTTARARAGLELSPEEKIKAETSAQKTAAAQAEKIAAEERRAAESRALIGEREASQRRMVDYREGKKGGKGGVGDKQANKDLNDAIDFHLKARKPNSPERKAIEDTGETPPPILTALDAQTVKAAVKEQVAKGADADEATQWTLEAFDGLKASGASPKTVRTELKELSDSVDISGPGDGVDRTSAAGKPSEAGALGGPAEPSQSDDLDSFLASAPDKIRQIAAEQLKTKSREEVLRLLMESAQKRAAGANQPVR
jgi:hypothetical protein